MVIVSYLTFVAVWFAVAAARLPVPGPPSGDSGEVAAPSDDHVAGARGWVEKVDDAGVLGHVVAVGPLGLRAAPPGAALGATALSALAEVEPQLEWIGCPSSTPTSTIPYSSTPGR